MAAYAALTSLMNMIHLIQNHPSPPISLRKQQVETLTEIVTFLQQFLEGYNSPVTDNDEADPLEMRIADAAYAAEDVIESNIVDRIQSQRNKMGFFNCFRSQKKPNIVDRIQYGEKINLVDLYEGLQKVTEDMDLIKNQVMEIVAEKEVVEDQLQRQVSSASATLTGLNSPVVDNDEADPLEMRIADAAYAAKDVIESNIVDRILPPAPAPESQRNKMLFFNCFRSQKKPNDGEKINVVDQIQSQRNKMGFFNYFRSQKKHNIVDLYDDRQKVIEDMDLIKKQVMEMVAEKEVVEDELQRQVSSASATLNNTMVGFDDVCLEVMDKLTDGRLNRHVIPIVGMGGIGKTTLAKNIYAQPLIKDRFDICAWTTISQKYNTKEILSDLLSQVNKEGSEDEPVGEALYKYLYGRRFLIVLDDMWSIEAWEKMQRYFPDNGNSSRILVTTRLSNLGSQLDNNYSLEMKFLDEVSSWGMFSEIVFKVESCPLELKIIGKKIVESCRGLPLSIVVMGGLLEKLERTKKCWESIRRNLNSLVNSENDEHCLKILKMSYNHLPVYLKPCFLYMGVYGEDRAIRVSTVIKLWVSEGFLKPISEESLETTAKGYIKELVDRNLILVDKLGSTGSVKFCKIHDLLRDLCLRESQKERFYHVVGQQSPPSTGSERCIVIPGPRWIFNAIKSTPYVRSWIGDDWERVQLLPNLRLLRILKVYDRDLYAGQPRYSINELFKFVNLRFLAAKVDRDSKLHSSIHRLWSLQTLIIDPSEKVDACVKIWKMPQLRHVLFYREGFQLPDPPRDGIVIMENLQTLTGVVNFKFDEEVVRRIPNINKLRLVYDDRYKGSESNDDHYCLHNIESLHKLESISCEFYLDDDYLKNLSFPHSLKKLKLQNRTAFQFNYVEDMFVKVGSLPFLEKLSLLGESLRTGTWEVVEGQFPSLKFLSLNFILDLEIWTTESSPFPCLEHLHLKGLPLLKEIPTEIGEIPTLKSIVLDICSASAVKSMKKIVEEQQELQGDDLPFKVQVFLDEENEELQNLANPNFQVTRR